MDVAIEYIHLDPETLIRCCKQSRAERRRCELESLLGLPVTTLGSGPSPHGGVEGDFVGI